MRRCWCHAAMAGWLGAPLSQAGKPAEAVSRWQHECEKAGGDCAGRVEAIALRLPTARALRRGRLLKIFTRGGELHFVDEAPHDTRFHRYLGMLHPGDFHLLWHRGPEGDRFITIQDGDGHQSRFDQLAAALEHGLGTFRDGLAAAR